MNIFYTHSVRKKSVYAFLLGMAFMAFLPFSGAQVRVPFAPRTSPSAQNRLIYNIQGDYTMIGNSNMTLVTYGNTTNNSNNQMLYVNVDPYNLTANGDAPVNSSAATLVFKPENESTEECTNIVYAGLYWTGRTYNSSIGTANTFTSPATTVPSEGVTPIPAGTTANITHSTPVTSYTNYTMRIETHGSAYSQTVSRQGEGFGLLEVSRQGNASAMTVERQGTEGTMTVGSQIGDAMSIYTVTMDKVSSPANAWRYTFTPVSGSGFDKKFYFDVRGDKNDTYTVYYYEGATPPTNTSGWTSVVPITSSGSGNNPWTITISGSEQSHINIGNGIVINVISLIGNYSQGVGVMNTVLNVNGGASQTIRNNGTVTGFTYYPRYTIAAGNSTMLVEFQNTGTSGVAAGSYTTSNTPIRYSTNGGTTWNAVAATISVNNDIATASFSVPTISDNDAGVTLTLSGLTRAAAAKPSYPEAAAMILVNDASTATFTSGNTIYSNSYPRYVITTPTTPVWVEFLNNGISGVSANSVIRYSADRGTSWTPITDASISIVGNIATATFSPVQLYDANGTILTLSALQRDSRAGRSLADMQTVSSVTLAYNDWPATTLDNNGAISDWYPRYTITMGTAQALIEFLNTDATGVANGTYTISNSPVRYSTDGGVNWTYIPTTVNTATNIATASFSTPVSIYDSGGNTLSLSALQRDNRTDRTLGQLQSTCTATLSYNAATPTSISNGGSLFGDYYPRYAIASVSPNATVLVEFRNTVLGSGVPNDGTYDATTTPVWYSTNNGATWARVPGTTTIRVNSGIATATFSPAFTVFNNDNGVLTLTQLTRNNTATQANYNTATANYAINGYALTATITGTTANFQTDYYPRYVFSAVIGSYPIIEVEFRNFPSGEANERIRYRSDGGGWIVLSGFSISSGTGNITVNLSPAITLYDGDPATSFKLTLNGLRRATGTTSGTSFVNTSNNYAMVSVSGVFYGERIIQKNLNKQVVYLRHVDDPTYETVIASTNNFQQNIYYPPTTVAPQDGATHDDGYMYSAYADITPYVKEYGWGEYIVADIALMPGTSDATGYYGGWGMVVVYENSQMTWRDITVFDGHAYVAGSATLSHNLDVTGFYSVQEGPVNVKLGMMAGEGDVGITGDYFSISRQTNGVPNGTFDRLSHAGNATDNFFNSTIYTGDNPRRPNQQNNTGMDISMFNIDNTGYKYIQNEQRRTLFRYGSTQDTYIIFCIVVGIDAYIPTPEALNVIVGVTNPDGERMEPDSDGNYSNVQPGAIITYDLLIYNKSPEQLDNLLVTFPAPYNTIFLEDNTQVYYDREWINPAGTWRYVPTTSMMEWRVGNVPTSVNWDPDDRDHIFASMRFSVQVTTDCELLVTTKECQPDVVINGETSGVGHDSGVPFSGWNFIYGHRDFPCDHEPITTPPVINVEAAVFCESVPVEDFRTIVTCELIPPNSIVPYEAVASAFPFGTTFWDSVGEDGKPMAESTQYDASSGFPLVSPGPDGYFYAVPLTYATTCLWKFVIKSSDIPSFAIEGSPANTCQGVPVDLTNFIKRVNPEHTILHFYKYSDGTGEINSVVTPDHPGDTTFYVRGMLVGYQCFTDLEEVLLYVAPKAIINPITATACNGVPFSVTPVDETHGAVPPNTTYSWTAPTGYSGIGGLAAGNNQPAISGTLTNSNLYSVAVTYTVTPVTTTGNDVCTGTPFTIVVTVYPNLSAPVLNTPSPFCLDDNTDITEELLAGKLYEAASGVSYAYYKDRAATIPVAFPITYDANKSDTLYARAMWAGTDCGGSSTTQMIFLPIPSMMVEPEGDQTICSGSGGSITMTFTGVGPWRVFFAKEDNEGTITGSEVTVPANMNPFRMVVPAETFEGLEWVKYTNLRVSALSNGNSICSRNIEGTIVININQDALFLRMTGNTTICSGGQATLHFTITDEAFPNNEYDYPQPDGWKIIVTNGTITRTAYTKNKEFDYQADPITSTTTYRVLSISNGECTNTVDNDEVIVTVFPTPVIPNYTLTICSGQTFTITPQTGSATVVPAGTTYTWAAPDPVTGIEGLAGGSNQSSISGTLTNTTTTSAMVRYTVTPTAPGTPACSGIPFTVMVTVEPLPTIIEPVNRDTSICIGQQIDLARMVPVADGDTVAFYLTAETIDRMQIVTVAPSTDATYYYRILRKATGCMSDGVAGKIDVTVSSEPMVSAITVVGEAKFCVGKTITLSNATVLGTGAKGIWSSSDTSVATVTDTGDGTATVTGIAPGPALIYYTVDNGCTKSVQLPIEILPDASGTSVIIGIQK